MSRLEFAVAPADSAALVRLSALQRVGRATPVQILWHDTPGGTLALQGRSVSSEYGLWRLEALGPAAASWPPATPTPILATASSPRLLDLDPAELAPIAAFTGQRRRYSVPLDTQTVTVAILSGALRGVATEQRVCRVSLEGPDAQLHAIAAQMAAGARISVPRAGLGAEAVAVARGQDVTPRHLGTPAMLPGRPLSDNIAVIVGQLLDVMLHWSGPASAGDTPMGVHQMRVATRRLRSAFSIFRDVAACDHTAALSPALRDLAAILGGARDWDVFLAGTGADVAAAFPGDRRVRTMLAAAARRRTAAYDSLRAYLISPAFRNLEVTLGCTAALRPWETPDDSGPLRQDTALFATTVLTRRHRRVRRAGRHINALPVEALHEMRKDCKRLRYAAEFFQPLFPVKPGRRYVRALAALQEELGALNDGAVAAGLMGHLGRTERSYAAGIVAGFVAANAGNQRAGIVSRWERFRANPEFWTLPRSSS